LINKSKRLFLAETTTTNKIMLISESFNVFAMGFELGGMLISNIARFDFGDISIKTGIHKPRLGTQTRKSLARGNKA
jgi:hypothetical protein